MRTKCEFKTCGCDKFITYHNNICNTCNHHLIWHKNKKEVNPPTDSFVSPRQNARKPIYVTTIKRSTIHVAVEVFVPITPELPTDLIEEDYCTNFNELPI